jgi:hypothetical protein
MSEPPRDRLEFWVRFICAFVFFGLVSGVMIFKNVTFDQPNLGQLYWALTTLAISLLAARVGDAAWRGLCTFFFYFFSPRK